MKHVAATVVGIALVVDVVILVGLAYGTGAASLTTTNGLFFGPTWHNDTGGTGGALQPNVYVQLGTLPMVSSMISAGTSTTITFGMQVLSNNNCGNAGDPAWAPGYLSPAYYAVQFLINGQAQKFQPAIDGTQQPATYSAFVSNNGTYQSSNGDGNIYACYDDPSAGNIQTTNFGGQAFFLHTINLNGLTGAGTLQITIPAGGPLCDGTPPVGTSGTPICRAGASAAGTGGFVQAQGSWSTNSYVDVPVIDGESSMTLVGGGPWYNGGSLQVSVTTGYGGPNGFTVSVFNPTARNNALATSWPSNPQIVSNQLLGGIFTFQIPSNAAQNSTVPGYNQFQLELTSPALGQSIEFPVTIGPQYAPSVPAISYTTSSGFVYPLPGDTLTLTFTAVPPSANATSSVGSFLVSIFYLSPGGTPQSSNTCDASWVTACNGTVLVATGTGSGTLSATYSFTVNVPLGKTGIGIRAQSESGSQQSSGIAYRFISIQPSGCNPGSPCDPSNAGSTLWKALGPLLFVVAIFLLVTEIVIWVPIPITYKYAVLAITGLGTVVLYFLLGSQFVPGGIFG